MFERGHKHFLMNVIARCCEPDYVLRTLFIWADWGWKVRCGSCGLDDRSSGGDGGSISSGQTFCSSDSDGLQEWLIEEASATTAALKMTVLLRSRNLFLLYKVEFFSPFSLTNGLFFCSFPCSVPLFPTWLLSALLQVSNHVMHTCLKSSMRTCRDALYMCSQEELRFRVAGTGLISGCGEKVTEKSSEEAGQGQGQGRVKFPSSLWIQHISIGSSRSDRSNENRRDPNTQKYDGSTFTFVMGCPNFSFALTADFCVMHQCFYRAVGAPKETTLDKSGVQTLMSLRRGRPGHLVYPKPMVGCGGVVTCPLPSLAAANESILYTSHTSRRILKTLLSNLLLHWRCDMIVG